MSVTAPVANPADHGPYLPDGRPFRVRAVVFDFDGTLTLPGALDFAAIHAAVGCPADIGLLEYLAGIEDRVERRRKEAVLSAAEADAADRCLVNEGAAALLAYLREQHTPMAIITRNSREAVERATAHLPEIDLAAFTAVITRDLPINPKPFPDGVELAAARLGVATDGLLVIGDHAFDIEAGKRAGALTMFLRNNPAETKADGGADFVVDTLDQARQVVRYGLPLPAGKLPPDLLEEALAGIMPFDPALLVGAGPGQDAAALDVGSDEVLVLASDPITLAAGDLAHYTVLVNANDVATSGATPRWLLTTLLFPPGVSGSEVLALVRDLRRMCGDCGITLCGGHTEITDAVSRPLVVGTMAGTARRSELVDKRDMRQGDRLLMTKRVAVEGTGLLAREFGGRLLEAGMTAGEIAEAAGFVEHIGIMDEARIARSSGGVTALHDVTEGGLATAVRELGAAGGRRLRLHLDKVPVYPQTAGICHLLGLDPLGLIGSGSLLITCSTAAADPLAAALAGAGIEVTQIGEVLERGEGIEAFEGASPAVWPHFTRDEVSRLTHG